MKRGILSALIVILLQIIAIQVNASMNKGGEAGVNNTFTRSESTRLNSSH